MKYDVRNPLYCIGNQNSNPTFSVHDSRDMYYMSLMIAKQLFGTSMAQILVLYLFNNWVTITIHYLI